MLSTRGRFIVLEGADGCGKSTQAGRLVASLEARGVRVCRLREPGSTRVGEAVRAVLLDRATGALSPRAEAPLYPAARAQLVGGRWTLSTEVYQGVAAGLGADVVRAAAPLAEHGLRPDLVIVLDVEEGRGLARLSGAPDRMESKGEAFHASVVRGYRELAAGRPRHRLVPPGTPDQVAAQGARLAREVGR